MAHSEHDSGFKDRRPWNAGRKLGAKRALKPQQVWAVRFWLDRALLDLAIDGERRGCDPASGGRARAPAIVVQGKAGRPVQFEGLEPARTGILAWLECPGGRLDAYPFPRVDRVHPNHNSGTSPLLKSGITK